MKVITLYHIPRELFVLILHENPRISCAELRVQRGV